MGSIPIDRFAQNQVCANRTHSRSPTAQPSRCFHFWLSLPCTSTPRSTGRRPTVHISCARPAASLSAEVARRRSPAKCTPNSLNASTSRSSSRSPVLGNAIGLASLMASKGRFELDDFPRPRIENCARPDGRPKNRQRKYPQAGQQLVFPQSLSVCPVQPIFRAIDWIVAQRDGCSCSCSRTTRTARLRTSSENLFVVLLMAAPPSRELEPPANPGRSTSSFLRTSPISPSASSLSSTRTIPSRPSPSSIRLPSRKMER
jgi:hypothetical protein